MDQLTSLGWQTNKETGAKTVDAEVVLDAANIPLTKTEDGDEVGHVVTSCASYN